MPKKPRDKKPKTKNPKKNYGGRYRQKNALKNNITVVVDNSKKTSTRKPSHHNPPQTSSFPVQHIQTLPSPEIPNLLAYLKEREKPIEIKKEKVEIKTEPIAVPISTPKKEEEKEELDESYEREGETLPVRQVGRGRPRIPTAHTPTTRARMDRANEKARLARKAKKDFISQFKGIDVFS